MPFGPQHYQKRDALRGVLKRSPSEKEFDELLAKSFTPVNDACWTIDVGIDMKDKGEGSVSTDLPSTLTEEERKEITQIYQRAGWDRVEFRRVQRPVLEVTLIREAEEVLTISE